jgi:hypothetical protein
MIAAYFKRKLKEMGKHAVFKKSMPSAINEGRNGHIEAALSLWGICIGGKDGVRC